MSAVQPLPHPPELHVDYVDASSLDAQLARDDTLAVFGFGDDAPASAAPAVPRPVRKRRRLSRSVVSIYRPLSVLMRCVNSSTFARLTISVGTMICLVAGMNERSPRNACAIRVMA